ncbi:hypothetical protein [Streptomyces sp. NPDC002853]
MAVRGRRGRVLYAVAFAGAAVVGAAACDPVAGGMNTAAIAITTDEMATKELERQRLDVLWISCTARYKSRVTPSSGSPDRDAVATVDCQGQAKTGKGSDDTSDITVKGSVRSVVDGHCVRGNLTAKVDGVVIDDQAPESAVVSHAGRLCAGAGARRVLFRAPCPLAPSGPDAKGTVVKRLAVAPCRLWGH